MTPEDRIQRARAAKGLLENEVLAAAFEALDAGYVRDWRAARDAAERERLHTAVTCLSALRAELQRYVTDGDITKKRLGND